MKGCDAVLNLAALIAIPYSYHSTDMYVDMNVKGGAECRAEKRQCLPVEAFGMVQVVLIEVVKNNQGNESGKCRENDFDADIIIDHLEGVLS